MNEAATLCPNCYTPLPSSHWNLEELKPCPACEIRIQAAVFPAASRTIAAGQSGERILVEGESSCFYHEQKKAVVPCDACGRFLCALCDLEFGDKHFCPACLDASREKGALKQQLETRRILYDNAAFLLAVTPIVLFFFWFFTLVTAPLAIAVGIYSFFQQNSLLGFSRLKAIAAIFLGACQVTAWVLMFLGVIDNLIE